MEIERLCLSTRPIPLDDDDADDDDDDADDDNVHEACLVQAGRADNWPEGSATGPGPGPGPGEPPPAAAPRTPHFLLPFAKGESGWRLAGPGQLTSRIAGLLCCSASKRVGFRPFGGAFLILIVPCLSVYEGGIRYAFLCDCKFR